MSTKERGHAALGHILQAIADYRVAVGDLDLEALILDRTRYYAAERLVEIISEASRRIPQEWKNEFPNVPWRDIAAVGNVLRHNYAIVDHQVVHDLRGEPLIELERVVRRISVKHGSSRTS